MTVKELKKSLGDHPASGLVFEFEDGSQIPAHFHVTEVGHVTKDFVDCGGTRRTTASCVLQTLVAHDTDHRLSTTRLAAILELTGSVLPNLDLPVEVEVDQGTVAVFSLNEIKEEGQALHLRLTTKHTACLAPDKCGLDDAPTAPSGEATPPASCDPAANC
ncbi:MAG: hypothetical protein ACI9R3_001145 [Verrucomicrobiales bacterium]|jgi:hypothetical protein